MASSPSSSTSPPPTRASTTPLRFTFELYSSLIPPAGISAIQVFRNGVLVPPCTGAPQAMPDPCVESRTLLVNGNAQIAVLTSAASRWSFGTEPEAVVTPPSNIERPSISGTAQDGETPTATTGAWNGTEPISYSYQWERCTPGCEDIDGANGPTLLLGPADVGATIRVEVTADNTLLAGGGTATAKSLDSPWFNPSARRRTRPRPRSRARRATASGTRTTSRSPAPQGTTDPASPTRPRRPSRCRPRSHRVRRTATRRRAPTRSATWPATALTAGPITGNKIDRKAPALSLPADMTVNATSPAGATVNFSASASDGANPNPSVTCTPASGRGLRDRHDDGRLHRHDHVGNQSSGRSR